MSRSLTIFTIACFAVAAFGCAQSEETEYGVIEQEVLDTWISKQAPQAQLLDENLGIYYELVTPAADPSALSPEPGDWVMVDYEVRDLQGNTVYTRSKERAKRLGSYNKYAHYVDDYFVISTSPSYTSMPVLFYALTQMKEGEVWTLYTPSRYIFSGQGFSNGIGYGGQYSLGSSKPAIIYNLKLNKVVKDPDLFEQEKVEAVAFDPAPAGWDLEETDALKRHYYREFLSRGIIEDTIRVDSAARFYYKGKLLDNTLFDANIDSVWKNAFGALRYDASGQTIKLVDDTTALSITRKASADVSTTMPAKVFSLLFQEERKDMKLRYGDSLRIVVTSPYAFGEKGRPGYKTTSSSSTTYSYNPYYYAYGGYQYYGSDYYNGYYDNSDYYTSGTSSSRFPIAEIKGFTPVIYELVVRRPAGKTGPAEPAKE